MNSKTSYTFPFAQYPAVRLTGLFICGILISQTLSVPLTASIIVVFATLLLYVAIELVLSKKLSFLLPKIATILYFFLVISGGFLRTNLQVAKALTSAEQLISVSPWEEIIIDGEVTSISETAAGKTRLNVKVSTVETISGLEVQDKFSTRLLWDELESIELGGRIKLKGTIIPVSSKRNPLAFDYKKFLASKGIHTQVRVDSLISIATPTTIFSWITIRGRALSVIDTNFSEETAPIAKALLLGYKNELEGETKTAFARAGLSHIMAVSGLHVGLVVAPFWLIIPYFWTKKYGSQIGLIILMVTLFIYAGITGFSASVLRASVMATALTYGKLFSKRSNSINLTAAAAFIILLVSPTQLFEIGFQLSFSAVLIILLMMPVIQSKLPYWIRVRWYGAPIMVMVVSLVVQFGLYPLQVFYFGEISLISPIANALFVPFLSLVVPVALLSVVVGFIIPALGLILNYPAELFLEMLKNFVELSAMLNWGWMKVGLGSIWFFGFWAALVLTISSIRNYNIRWKMLSISLLMIILIQVEGIHSKISENYLEVLVYDVGQGDAILVTTPQEKHILIDAGTWSPSGNSGKQVIVPHLKSAGISKLDAIILSHPHADHIGGIITLLDEIEIGVIYNSGYQYDSNLYHSYLEKAKEKGVKVQSVKAGDRIDLDPTVLLLVLGPDGTKQGSDPNQHSVVLNMIYGENEFLFTGDAGENQEQRLVKRYGELLDTDFLKVGHHGSKTSSEDYFLEQVTPQMSVVSLADKNKFRHPHQEAIQRLVKSGTNTYFTSRDKALIFKSDGNTITKTEWE